MEQHEFQTTVDYIDSHGSRWSEVITHPGSGRRLRVWLGYGSSENVYMGAAPICPLPIGTPILLTFTPTTSFYHRGKGRKYRKYNSKWIELHRHEDLYGSG
jgi:hypothetical protein